MFSGANQSEEAGHDLRRHVIGPDSASADLVGILDTVDVPILVLARDGSLSRFNHAAADALNLAAADIGRPACALGALAHLKNFEMLCMQVLGDAIPCRREIQSGDRTFLLRLTPYLGSNGQMGGIIVTLTNITAFRASIDQAIYEREFTKAILNTVSDPLVVLGTSLQVQTANRAFYALFGVSRENSQAVPLFKLGNDDWKNSTLWASLQAVLSDDGEFQPLELDCEFPAVGHRTVILSARRLARDRDVMVLLTFHDITDRKRAEAVIMQNQKALLEADRRKDEFLATLAHELRNPLAPIQNSLNVLRLSGPNPVIMSEIQEVMERQVKHMVRLVDDLLEISRINTGKVDLRLEAVEIASVIRTAVETSQPMIKARSHELATMLPALPLTVQGDAVRLSQVFSNLLNNAARYTPTGGRIAVRVQKDRDEVAISVRDTGIGIAPEMLTRIFGMFTQVQPAGHTVSEGLGIGLALAHSLVELHGGRIEARSDGEGRGSEFVVWLPLLESDPAHLV